MKPKTITKLGAGTLAVVAIASLVGSISGTIAWFQYTTRVTANYTGVVTHATENIEMRIGNDDKGWKTNLTADDVQKYLLKDDGGNRDDTKLRPVTTGIQDKGGKLDGLYKNPIYQYGRMGTWGVADAKHDYINLPFQIRVKDVDGTANSFLGKNIYLTGLSIENKTGNTKYDISDALRVHIDTGTKSATFSKTGADVTPYGYLDLNGDYADDTYTGFGEGTDKVLYGATEYAAKPAALNKGHYLVYNVPGSKVWNESTQAWDNGVSTSKEYYVWDGANWSKYTGEGAPSGADTIDAETKFLTHYAQYGEEISTAANLKTALNVAFYEGDVIKVGTAYSRLVRTKDDSGAYVLAWKDLEGNAAKSYAVDDSTILADDTDPHNIKGTAIGKTHGYSATLAEMLKKGDYVYVSSVNRYYTFNGTAWAGETATEPTTGTNQGEYETLDAVPTPASGEIVYVADKKATYKWDTSDDTEHKWVVNAGVDTNGAAKPDPKDADINKTYYDGEGIWKTDGVKWEKVDSLNDYAINVNVTIYLEGWQQLPSEKDAIEASALPAYDADDSIHNGARRVLSSDGKDYTWVGHEWREGKLKYVAGSGWIVDNSLDSGATVATLPTSKVWVGKTYRVKDALGAEHLLHWDGEKWANGGYSIWDAANYVDSAFSIGFRFSAEAHTNHN